MNMLERNDKHYNNVVFVSNNNVYGKESKQKYHLKTSEKKNTKNILILRPFFKITVNNHLVRCRIFMTFDNESRRR